MLRVLFSSDIHGNEIQYKKLVDYAISISADAVVIGGDITPKDAPTAKFIQNQRRFLKYKLPKIFLPLKQDLPESKIFLIMGNDDCAANLDVLENQSDELYEVINQKRVRLSEEFDIVGYPYVPITPFRIKDWEKIPFKKIWKIILYSYSAELFLAEIFVREKQPHFSAVFIKKKFTKDNPKKFLPKVRC